MSDEPGLPEDGGERRELLAGLRAVIEAKDTEIAVLGAELAAERELRRRLELKVAELERRLGSDSTTSGTAPSKDPIAARERRKAERKKERQSSERERREDRKRGGQPGHPGAGLSREPDPDQREELPPPAQCSRCGAGLEDAERAGTWWSQVRDVRIAAFVTEYLLPLLACPCCGKVNAAELPPWAHPGSVSYGPGINTAAVLLQAYGNVPSERTANLIRMLLGIPVSPGFVDLASERLSSRLQDAGFDEAMQAALAAEPVLAADETPVNLLDARAGLDEDNAGAPHVLVIRTPHRGLTWLRAPGSRQHAAITTILAFFTGFLISDGYGAYQDLLPQLAGIQQCCQHVIRRARAVTKLGPGGLQSWPATSSTCSAKPIRPSETPGPGATRRWTRSCWPSCASATTRPSPSGSPTTGCGTGTAAATTPATPWAAGCATIRNRSGCSPPSSLSSGRITAPSRRSRPPSGTRPSPATGTPTAPSPAGAASGPTLTPPRSPGAGTRSGGLILAFAQLRG